MKDFEKGAEYREVQFEYYSGRMSELRGSFDFLTGDDGLVTLREMTDNDITDVIKARFAMPSQEDIDAQRVRFIKQYEKDLKKDRERARKYRAKKKKQKKKRENANQPSIAAAFGKQERSRKRRRLRITIEESESE